MKEEADPDILGWRVLDVERFANQLWKKHQVIVLHPEHIVVLQTGGDGIGKDLVGLAISIPGRLVKVDSLRMVMEEWPQNRVGEPCLSAINIRR